MDHRSAKNLVAVGNAKRCLVRIAYAIGTVAPMSFLIDTQGTGELPDEQLETMARDVFPLTPQGIIDALDLCRPIYAPTAAYGHFGREDVNLFWERTDGVAQSVSHPVAYPHSGGVWVS